MQLNDEQEQAVADMLTFLASGEKFFLLQGAAGTGKTSTIQALAEKLKGRLVFTAPTNKAVRVLYSTLVRDDYKPDCRTIYSLLGLRLEANGEVKELTAPENPLDLTKFAAVIVDEASMLNEALMRFITGTAETQGVRFIFLGDPAQLPPVKEKASKVWEIERGTSLRRVMRHDNQILALATKLRAMVGHPVPQFKFDSDNAGGEGVWRCGGQEFESRLYDAAAQGKFNRPNGAKAIAWRNVTVAALNRKIRARIFDSPTCMWLPGDRFILTEPAVNLENTVIATTDEEGTVVRVEEDWHPLYGNIKIWLLHVTTDENEPLTLRVVHSDYEILFAHEVAKRAEEARAMPRRWKDFWEFKAAFHQVRHGYAITAHRSQGSTYDTAFVDWRDILINRERGEAFRCLYVACTRARKELYLG